MFAALFATLFFSISGVSGARATRKLIAPLANLLRFTAAMIVLAILAFTIGQGFAGPSLVLFLISGLVGFGLGDTALFEAYARIGSRRTILLTQALAAPIGAATEFLWLGATLTSFQVMCIGIILFGVLIALKPSGHQIIPRSILVIGVLCGIGAAFGQAWGAVLSRKAFTLAAEVGFAMDPLTATFQRLLGGIGLPLILVLRHWRRGPSQPGRTKITPSALGWCVLTGISGPVIGVACFQQALSTTPSGIVLAIVATTPLVILPLSWWSEGDRPTLSAVLGGACAVAGVIGLFLQ